MENASKALLMAASILIGIVVLSLGIYLVNTFKSFSDNYTESIELQRMEEFNAQFTAFSTRNNVSIHEILTLTNFAKEFNSNNGLTPGQSQYIEVKIKIKNKEFDLADEECYKQASGYKNYNSFISDLLDGTYIYKEYGDSVEKLGQYQYDKEDRNKCYNCYECKNYNVNPRTGRVESITFEFLKNI